VLRLLADDLTGALDSAAPFAAVRGAMPVWWHDVGVRGGDAAFDSETRDAGTSVARARVARLARHMIGAELAYKKIDSCLRGQPAAEIAATNREGRFRTVVVAPAFPAQGRVTRQGRQLVRDGDGWRDTGVDIARELAAEGLMARHGTPGPGGDVFVCDADQDADLAEIAASPGLSPPVLWCGSGGLARALAGPAAYLPVADALPPPTLLVVGTAHPATLAQLAWLDKLPSDIRIARVDLPPGSPASHARAALEQLTASLADSERPGSVLVIGGETMMSLVTALGARSLRVEGELAPGIAVARFVGGRWHDLRVVSRSGGFGLPDVLAALLGVTARA
jgi:D-threonate/D-erythronate kinase